MSWTDALGREVELARTPRRIVSLVPSITEALFAFGLAKKVVGVTKFCVEPRGEVDDVAKVGGTKNVDVAAVKALKPDLVIANAEENEKADIDTMEADGLQVFVTFPRSIAAATAMMRTMAEMTGCEKAAAPQVAAVDATAALTRARNGERPPLRVFCPIWRRPWMSINADTYMHDVLLTCGLQNVCADDKERYPEVDLSDMASRRPDIAILPDEPFPFAAKHAGEISRAIPGVAKERIYLVDGKDICWYSPRIAGALGRIEQTVWGDHD